MSENISDPLPSEWQWALAVAAHPIICLRRRCRVCERISELLEDKAVRS